MWHRFAALALVYPVCCLAQGLRVSSVTGAPGAWVTVEVSFAQPSQREMVALQWEVEIPPDSVDLEKYRAATIWCKRFSVNFGTAPLTPVAGESAPVVP